ncbi:hypothetical protein SP99_04571 [Enterobacter sp. BIDMC92]|nr:hypothetical protein SP99_04571 [Enterobacter sp. BIDMC92]
MKRTIFFTLSTFLMAMTTCPVYASTENTSMSDLRVQKTIDSSYCNPGLHRCEVPFTIGKGNNAKPDGTDKNYCNPNSVKCNAPFTIDRDHIAKSDGTDKRYCNPNSIKCNAPFTTGYKYMNQ